jgi:hypothetical protein|tara:strand:- start:58 stop:288 length:231 start_codon:yes stop_codon:yes gene_type:complete
MNKKEEDFTVYTPIIFHLRDENNTKGFYHNYYKPDGEFSHQILITDPNYDVTGRFKVNPKEYYNLTDGFLKRFNSK